MMRAIEQHRPRIEAVPDPPAGSEGPWWRRTLGELQEREAAARQGQRELRLKLDRASADLKRAQARLAVRDRTLAATRAELESLRAEHSGQEDRAQALERQLAELKSSRVYRLVRVTWRIRAAMARPFRRRRAH